MGVLPELSSGALVDALSGEDDRADRPGQGPQGLPTVADQVRSSIFAITDISLVNNCLKTGKCALVYVESIMRVVILYRENRP